LAVPTKSYSPLFAESAIDRFDTVLQVFSMCSNCENLRSARTGQLSQSPSPGAIAMLAVLILLGVLCCLRFQFYHEPVYRGKALTVWLQTYDPSSAFSQRFIERSEADDAVRHIGTNAIPILLQMLGETDSILKLRLIALAERQQVLRFHFVRAETLYIEASRAFVVLGDSARDAVPDLIKLYNENISADSQCAIEDALSLIGPGAKPALTLLLRAATNSDHRVRANALWALGDIHAEPQLCVPVLVLALSDSHAGTRDSAVHALGMFGTNAQSAVPALWQLAHDTRISSFASPRERFEASQALRKINPDAGSPSDEKLSDFEVPAANLQLVPR
jgi:hypothetical protein